jgi:hypothetical protein
MDKAEGDQEPTKGLETVRVGLEGVKAAVADTRHSHVVEYKSFMVGRPFSRRPSFDTKIFLWLKGVCRLRLSNFNQFVFVADDSPSLRANHSNARASKNSIEFLIW